MPNENDERYEGTFETFSTQGYKAGDKFDLDEMKGNLSWSRIIRTLTGPDTWWNQNGSKLKSIHSAFDVDTASDNRSVKSNGVTGYWIPSGYNGWEQSRMCNIL